MLSRKKALSTSSGLIPTRACRETGDELHPGGLTAAQRSWSYADHRHSLLQDASLFQPVIVYLRAFGFGLGELAADGPIALVDFFDGDPS
jgi:hypothetical protein